MERHRDHLFKSGAVWCVLTVSTDGIQIRKVHELRQLRSVYFTTLLEGVWTPGFATRNWHMQHMHQLHLGVAFLLCFMSYSLPYRTHPPFFQAETAALLLSLKSSSFTVSQGFLPFWAMSRCRESPVESLLWTFQQGHVLYHWQCISVILQLLQVLRVWTAEMNWFLFTCLDLMIMLKWAFARWTANWSTWSSFRL